MYQFPHPLLIKGKGKGKGKSNMGMVSRTVKKTPELVAWIGGLDSKVTQTDKEANRLGLKC